MINDIMQIELISENQMIDTNIEESIYNLKARLDDLSSKADNVDCFIAVASGVLCSMLDILWVGDFDLQNGRGIADEKINSFVEHVAKTFGCKDGDIKKSVTFLEKKFNIPSDGNTKDFGSGLKHHLQDFAHHPTIVGLLFSMLTQFTSNSYGTDKNGEFAVVPVPEKSRIFIGKDVVDKIMKGMFVWFFHLVSDIAGSSSTAGLSGGTGIPGPILSLAEEISVLPIVKELNVNDNSISKFLSKLFNGTLLAKYDENGKILKETVLKLDFRGEMGIGIELGKQAVPVIANECIVRTFYLLRRLVDEIKLNEINSIKELDKLDWNRIKLYDSQTLTRMLTIATGVFTTIDISEAVITQKYWVSVNYIGVGRFTVALGDEMLGMLKVRKVENIKRMYEEVSRNTYKQTDNNIYKRIGDKMDLEKFGLTLEETEILYNLELHKTLNDIEKTNLKLNGSQIVQLKQEWVKEWKNYIAMGFSGFTGIENAEIHWYTKEDLVDKIKSNINGAVWLKLVLLEVMLFEPYYSLSTEEDKKGNAVPSKKYKKLDNIVNGYKKDEGDLFLDTYFDETLYTKGFIERLRKTYNKSIMELNEVLKSAVKGISIAAVVTVLVVATAGALAPKIAVILVGSNFVGLSGAALTGACLAYLGGGAIAAGGLGMAGGTISIVGGSAILGLGLGAGAGGVISASGMMNEKQTIIQSAKLMTSVREIFLNDEHDIQYSNSVYEQYVKEIANIEKSLVDLRLQENVASKEEKKKLKHKIDHAEKSVNAMKIAMKSMNKFNSSFKEGMSKTE